MNVYINLQFTLNRMHFQLKSWFIAYFPWKFGDLLVMTWELVEDVTKIITFAPFWLQPSCDLNYKLQYNAIRQSLISLFLHQIELAWVLSMISFWGMRINKSRRGFFENILADFYPEEKFLRRKEWWGGEDEEGLGRATNHFLPWIMALSNSKNYTDKNIFTLGRFESILKMYYLNLTNNNNNWLTSTYLHIYKFNRKFFGNKKE